MKSPLLPDKARIHIAALGDVGATLATGLVLTGGDCVSGIGLYDLKPELAKRLEIELNQVLDGGESFPPAYVVTEERLFDCDVFVFCASVGVPPVGAAIADVRMAQYAGNARILAPYARMARERGFRGLFAVVSDPVDLLCRCAYDESNKNARGQPDGKGLDAGQIRGYGLGVMHARAVYYARREERFASYLTDGRAFGPHGQGLVIANSISAYDDVLSRELTGLVVEANKSIRALGFKPYIAPALSSGALSICATLRGAWHYSAVYDNGIFFGCKNRLGKCATETEALRLPAALRARLAAAREELSKEGGRWNNDYS